MDFQEAIRTLFPRFQEKSQFSIPNVEEILPEDMHHLLPQSGKHYEFSSLDETKTVVLNTDSLSLTTSNYGGWEEFVEDFKGALNALFQAYSPESFTRIGLRYQNIVLMSEMELSGVSWSELINPQLAGVLADAEIGDHVENSEQKITIRLSDETGFVRLRHGLGLEENSQEAAYLIDSDFYINQPQEAGNVLGVIEKFNRQSGHLFRWAIGSRLHEAMGPEQES